MAISKTYLVPVDFSKGAERALTYAAALARENSGKLLLVHVIPMAVSDSDGGVFFDYYALLEKDAKERFKKLAARHKLKTAQYHTFIVSAVDIARAIVSQAKKAGAAMIIMGSHGRTGLQRLMLGSVAERTLRYAECPVLIVKR
jgi:nucleotide-binding universal stress UspA family protein